MMSSAVEPGGRETVGDLPSMSSVLNLPSQSAEPGELSLRVIIGIGINRSNFPANIADIHNIDISDDSHYQLQGTWTLSTGRHFNYLVLKDSLESSADISNVYFCVEDVCQSPGCDNMNFNNINERLHINLLHLIMEFPTSEIVSELFRDFLNNLQPLASVQVSEKLCKRSRLLDSKVPKIQLKLDNYQYAGEAKENVWRDGTGDTNFSEKSSFEVHMHETQDQGGLEKLQTKLEHPAKNTSLKCEQCEKVFSSKKTKYAHLRSVHGTSNKESKTARPASACVCSVCGEKKKSEHNLSQHIKKFHENAFPEPIVCNLCTEIKQLRNRKYHTPYSFELHMRQIHR